MAVPDPTPDVYTQLLQIIQQSSIIPDESLTQAGKAADAKATGDAIDKVMQDVVQMVGETADDIMGSMADRVIEHGTDGAWYWEKWLSGKAVCWCRYVLGNVNVTRAWGNWYESDYYYVDFPTGLFSTAPDFLDITLMSSDGAAYISRYLEDMTATNTGRFNLSRATSRTVYRVVLGLYAIGRWK